MTTFSHHPGFRDVLWDFVRSSPLEDTLNVRLFSSDEELFERDETDEGFEWKVPRGLVPMRGEGRRMEPLDSQAALIAGQRLLMSLPDSVRAAALTPGPLPVRLKISGDAKEVRYLPWECLPLPHGVVARSVPVPYPVPPFAMSQPPVRVLFVVTNPKDERLLDSYRELAAIQVTSLSGYVHHVVSEPTLSGLERTLASVQPHIVHYVGHGGSSGGQGHIVLHDQEQHTYWVSARELAKVLPSSVRLLCLSTCFTAENYDVRGLPLFAQASADTSLPSTLVNRLPLGESSEPAIRLFWQTFYTELIQQRGDTSSAFAAAQSAIRSFSDWPSFSLVIRDGTGWGFAIGALTLESVETPSVDRTALKMAEFDALYSTSIANYLTQQTSVSPNAVRRVMRDHSRQEAQRAQEALSSLPDFQWPGKERP